LPAAPAAAEAVRGRVVLTPNPAEAALLLDLEQRDLPDLSTAARRIAERYEAVVSCGGTIASADGRAWSTPAGNPGLGTSGSGDVLAGALAGLLARGAPLDQAACWATYVHAASGDRLAATVGALGFLAREILDELPLVFGALG
jgi:NAD(P)H-hydrate repair Nnr-like enzyme with NAD(P)H-hydrate dehydratase domain